jgi:hypothetical protein
MRGPATAFRLTLGDATAQLDRVKRERAIGRMNPAARYSHANRNGPAMAASGYSGHAPVSIDFGRACRRSETDDYGSGR